MVLCHAFVRDPFLDLRCFANCADNVFLVRSDRDSHRDLDSHLVTGSRLRLRAHRGGGCLAPCNGNQSRQALDVVRGATSDLRRVGLRPPMPCCSCQMETKIRSSHLVPLRSSSCTLRPLCSRASTGIVWGVWRAYRTECALCGEWAVVLVWRIAAARVAGDRCHRPSDLGDESLSVAYRLPSIGQYVDATGRHRSTPCPAAARSQRRSFVVVNRLPWVLHDVALTPQARIGGPLLVWPWTTSVCKPKCSPSSLHLRASTSAASCRLPTRLDGRLERDLHDGAQQRLLAATYKLRLAPAASDSVRELGSRRPS